MTRFAFAVFVVLLFSIPAEAEEPVTVDALGDPSAIDFGGNVTFTAEEIRGGLALSPAFWVAAHPDARFPKFRDDLFGMIREGYRHAGFAHVDVQVSYAAKARRIRVSIVEGTRYLAAEPVVRGGEGLPVEDLLAELSEQSADLWVPGEPAPLDARTREWFRMSVERLLENLGRQSIRVDTTIALDREGPVARPVIHIEDPGVPGTITSIEVRGLKKNTRKQVIEFLAVPPGQLATQEFLADLWAKLDATCRFASGKVSVDPGEGIKVVLDLVELEGVPPLSEELPEKMQIMLRFRDWIATLQESGEELHFVFALPRIGRGEIAVAPRRGVAVDITPTGTSRPYSVVVGIEEYSLLSHAGRVRLSGPTGEGGAIIRVWFGVDATETDQPSIFRFSLGIDADPSGSRVRLQAGGSPAAFVRLAFRADSFTVEDGRAILDFTQARLVLDAATGRLLEFDSTREGHLARLRVTEESFEPARKRAERRGKKYLHVRNADSALGGLIEFAAFDFLRTGTDAGADSAVLSNILSKAVRAPLADLGLLRKATFCVPTAFDARDGLVDHEFLSLVLPAANLLFSPGSWPRDLGREAALTLAGKGKRTGQVLERLYGSDEVGPLGYLAIAWLLDLAAAPSSPYFAKKGLTVATAKGFRKDVKVLIDGKGAIGRYILRLTTVLRRLSPDDRAALGALFSRQHRKRFEIICRSYDRIEDRDDRYGARLTLHALYELGLGARIKAGLEALAGE